MSWLLYFTVEINISFAIVAVANKTKVVRSEVSYVASVLLVRSNPNCQHGIPKTGKASCYCDEGFTSQDCDQCKNVSKKVYIYSVCLYSHIKESHISRKAFLLLCLSIIEFLITVNCSPDVCQNGGICTVGASQCACPRSWTGLQCQDCESLSWSLLFTYIPLHWYDI